MSQKTEMLILFMFFLFGLVVWFFEMKHPEIQKESLWQAYDCLKNIAIWLIIGVVVLLAIQNMPVKEKRKPFMGS